MKIPELEPLPGNRESFRRDALKFVPAKSGCYVLATHDGSILYLGLARNLQGRMGQHLDSPEKVAPTPTGRAVWFYWFECEEVEKVERTWMGMYEIAHGKLPILNKVFSPVSY